jgi:hypothetical protein
MPDLSKVALRARSMSADDLLRICAADGLYAIIDACIVPLVPKKVLELGEQRATSLYRETAEQEFWEIAPYLLKVDGPLLRWMLPKTEAEGWGIFVASKESLETLRLHFRHFLRVQEPQGAIWLFRFYDPRVLKPFLASCSPNELRTFFGPVTAYGFCGPEPGPILFLQESISQVEKTAATSPPYAFMFRLQERHLAALRPVAETDFVKRLMRYVRDEIPQATDGVDDKVLEQRVRLGIARAKSYRLTIERNIALFVALMFEFAPNFDAHPHVRKILLDPALPTQTRMRLLGDEVSDEEWDEIQANSGSASWEAATKEN